MKLKVFLVDDHPMLRRGLRQTIEEQSNLTIIGEASTGEAALKLVAELAPDLVVMDLHLTDMNGIEVTRRILDILPLVKVMVFSGDATRSMVDEALQSGACGYIWKQSATDELIRAVEVVMAGKLYLSPEVSAGILEDYRKGLVEKIQPKVEPYKPVLSERDKQLMRLIAEGLRNKEIAVQLSISPKSVEAYRSRLIKSLGFGSSAELIRYAVREGIAVP